MFWDITTWFVIFVRFGACLLLFPVTSANNIPVMLRLGLAALSALLLTPILPAVTLAERGMLDLFGLFFLEVATGLTLGLCSRMIFYAVDIAGSIVATESGLMLSTTFNPISNATGAAPASLLHWMTMMLLLGLDLHHWILIGLQRSYELIPAGGAELSALALEEILAKGGAMFLIALQITAPILAASFIVTLIFALLARTVPQMNVFSESFPTRSITGLTVFGLTLTLTAQHVANHLNRIPEEFMRLARLL